MEFQLVGDQFFIQFSNFLFFFISDYRSTSKHVWTNWRICLSSISDYAIQWILRHKICRPQVIATTITIIAASTIIVVVRIVVWAPRQQRPLPQAQQPVPVIAIAVAHVVRIRQVQIVRQVWKWRQLSNQILRLPQNHSQVPQRMFKMSRFSHFTKQPETKNKLFLKKKTTKK